MVVTSVIFIFLLFQIFYRFWLILICPHFESSVSLLDLTYCILIFVNEGWRSYNLQANSDKELDVIVSNRIDEELQAATRNKSSQLNSSRHFQDEYFSVVKLVKTESFRLS